MDLKSNSVTSGLPQLSVNGISTSVKPSQRDNHNLATNNSLSGLAINAQGIKSSVRGKEASNPHLNKIGSKQVLQTGTGAYTQPMSLHNVAHDHSFDEISYEQRAFPVPMSDEFSGMNGKNQLGRGGKVVASDQLYYSNAEHKRTALTEPATSAQNETDNLNGISITGTSQMMPNEANARNSRHSNLRGNSRKMSNGGKPTQMRLFNNLGSQIMSQSIAPLSTQQAGKKSQIVQQQPYMSAHSSQGPRNQSVTETDEVLKNNLNSLPPKPLLDLGTVDLLNNIPLPDKPEQQNNYPQTQRIGSMPPQMSRRMDALRQSQKHQAEAARNGVKSSAAERGTHQASESNQNHDPDRILGQRQFESYMQRRQIIQQQREKKQELLKQLDSGLRHHEARPAGTEGNDMKSPLPLDGLRVDGIAHEAMANFENSGGPVNRRQVANHGQSNSISIKDVPKLMIQGGAGSVEVSNAVMNYQKTQLLQYASISPTRGIKYNMQQHQMIRGPAPNALGIVAKNRDQGASEAHSALNNNNFLPFASSLNQPQENTNIRIAPIQQQTEFTQFMQYQMSPNARNQPGVPPPMMIMQNNSVPVQPEQPQARALKPNPRTQKVYDYMFIQMSNEQFQKEYNGIKVFVASTDDDEPNKVSPHKTPDRKSKITEGSPDRQLDLGGLVQIKAYETQLTDEIPSVQCNLQPTQLDHLKVLVCEQEDKNHPKLTFEAAAKFEIEKQTQIKQYMEDIITKLQQKERRFKVTVKKKFIQDALINSTQLRIASVYVIVINREKMHDSDIQNRFRPKPKPEWQKKLIETSSEEDDLETTEPIVANQNSLRGDKAELNLQHRRSANSNLISSKKRSMYDSDCNNLERMTTNSTSTNIPNFKKLMAEKSTSSNAIGNALIQQNKNQPKNTSRKLSQIQTGPVFKRAPKKDDEWNTVYKYTAPVKDYSKYGATKIRIFQDIKAHEHMQRHPINIYFNQYNEFIKMVLKNQKLQMQNNPSAGAPIYKFNHKYAQGLAQVLCMGLKRDAFSEQNMKSREYVNQLREKLIWSFWKKITDSNRDLDPKPAPEHGLSQSDGEHDTLDSSSNQNNTPKSKNALIPKEQTNAPVSTKEPFVYPPQGIIYKYFIGKGNNSIMVRSLFKNRFWWIQHDKEELDKANFCWTQIRKIHLFDALKCKYPHKKSGIKNMNFQANQAQTILSDNVPGSNPAQSALSSILTTPQQKAKKKRLVSVQSSEKANSQNSASGLDKENEKGAGDKKKTEKDEKNEAEIIKKFLETRLYNKIEDNFHLNNKKALFLNMKNYYEALEQDVFHNLPVTFHVKSGLSDPEFERFKQFYAKTEEENKVKKALQKEMAKAKKKEAEERKKEAKDEESPNNSPEKENQKEDEKKSKEPKEPTYYTSPLPPRNIWIIKPGENTNRGHGIQVAKDFEEIKSLVKDSTASGRRTCIIQKYIHNPLLINRRKFDIRTFVMMTSMNGNHKVYIYEEGYLRTSCREYSINNLSNRLVHLTNDAVQKRCEDYGKFEPGNKLSYNEFQVFIDKHYSDLSVCFERDIKPQMNKITTDIFRAVYNKVDPKRRLNCLEVFGLDFMLDDEFKPYLIEVNTNPCLELSSPLLARLIPNMLENALKIGLDSQFLPPENFSIKKAYIGDPCPENRFELVYDSNVDAPVLDSIFKTKQNIISKCNGLSNLVSVEMDEDELSEEEEHDDEE